MARGSEPGRASRATTAWCDVRGDTEGRATPSIGAMRGGWVDAWLGEAGAREDEEIRREDGRAYVRVKAARAFPHAPREPKDAF